MAATSKPTFEELQAALQKSEASRQKLRATLVTSPLPSAQPPLRTPILVSGLPACVARDAH